MTTDVAKLETGKEVMALVPTTIEEAFRLSQAISLSHMAPVIQADGGRRRMTAEEVMATFLAGMEVGLKPMASLRSIALINGRPAFWGDGQLALVQSRDDYAGMEETMNGDTATCIVKRELPNGNIDTTERTFTMAQAKKAGLLGKKGPWQDYPERMLQHRARGWALRDAFSDAFMGILPEREARDMPDEDIPLIEGDVVEDSEDAPTPYEEDNGQLEEDRGDGSGTAMDTADEQPVSESDVQDDGEPTPEPEAEEDPAEHLEEPEAEPVPDDGSTVDDVATPAAEDEARGGEDDAGGPEPADTRSEDSSAEADGGSNEPETAGVSFLRGFVSRLEGTSTGREAVDLYNKGGGKVEAREIGQETDINARAMCMAYRDFHNEKIDADAFDETKKAIMQTQVDSGE